MAELLIHEVEKFPCIWDKNFADYQNPVFKKRAWMRVCRALQENFEELSESDREQICNTHAKRWRNIKDAYLRNIRKQIKTEKLGIITRPYVYSKHLSFITTGEANNDSNDPWSDDAEQQDEGNDAEIEDVKPIIENEITAASAMKRESVQVFEDNSKSVAIANFMASLPPPTMSLIRTSKSETPPRGSTPEIDPDRSFFESILPSIRDFDEDSKLEFRCEVLNLVQQLRSNPNSIFN